MSQLPPPFEYSTIIMEMFGKSGFTESESGDVANAHLGVISTALRNTVTSCFLYQASPPYKGSNEHHGR